MTFDYLAKHILASPEQKVLVPFHSDATGLHLENQGGPKVVELCGFSVKTCCFLRATQIAKENDATKLVPISK